MSSEQNRVLNFFQTEFGVDQKVMNDVLAAALSRGGDFADGVIAWQGMALGRAILATFDKTGIRILSDAGLRAAEPSGLLSER